MEIIKGDNGIILAIVIKADYSPEKTEFYTPDDFSQQLGIIKYQKGHTIPSHYHNTVNRNVAQTQEVLLVRKGKIKATIYNSKNEAVNLITLQAGDVILLANGGHGFEFLEDAEMIEVKQGPYLGDNDKIHFEK